jgi:hypothetical protein
MMTEPILNKQILWYKSKFQAFAGKMIITNTRFTFNRAPKWTLMLGALGALLAGSAKGKTLVDDDISNLKFSKGRKVGKKAYIIEVTTPDGKTHDFLFDDKLVAQVSSVITLEQPTEAV